MKPPTLTCVQGPCVLFVRDKEQNNYLITLLHGVG